MSPACLCSSGFHLSAPPARLRGSRQRTLRPRAVLRRAAALEPSWSWAQGFVARALFQGGTDAADLAPIDRAVALGFAEYARYFVAVDPRVLAVGLLLVQVLYDDFRSLSELGAGSALLARYVAVRLPSFLASVLPLALLVSLLYTLGRLHRSSELTAMRAAARTEGRHGLALSLRHASHSSGTVAAGRAIPGSATVHEPLCPCSRATSSTARSIHSSPRLTAAIPRSRARSPASRSSSTDSAPEGTSSSGERRLSLGCTTLPSTSWARSRIAWAEMARRWCPSRCIEGFILNS